MNAWIKKKTTKCIRTSLGRKVTKRQEKQIKLEALQLRLHSYMCTCRAFFFPATECSAFNAIYITPIHRAHSLFSRFISLKMFLHILSLFIFLPVYGIFSDSVSCAAGSIHSGTDLLWYPTSNFYWGPLEDPMKMMTMGTCTRFLFQGWNEELQ